MTRPNAAAMPNVPLTSARTLQPMRRAPGLTRGLVEAEGEAQDHVRGACRKASQVGATGQ